SQARSTDNVALLELTGLPDDDAADPVVERLAAVLAVRDQPDTHRHRRDQLVEVLRHKKTLLVIDNCEHVLAAVAATADRLLAAVPTLHILATSREPLGIPGERVRRVPPLDLPATDDHATAATELFVARATAADPAFALTPGNA